MEDVLNKRIADLTKAAILVAPPLLAWAFYLGPFRWLAEWQLVAFNEYRPGWTVLAVFLGWTLSIAALAKIAGIVRPGWRLTGEDELGGAMRPIVPAAFSVMAMVGLAIFAMAPSADAPTPCSMTSIIAGLECPSRFVSVSDAVPLEGAKQELVDKQRGSTTRHTYVPLAPSGIKDDQRAIAAFADLSLPGARTGAETSNRESCGVFSQSSAA